MRRKLTAITWCIVPLSAASFCVQTLVATTVAAADREGKDIFSTACASCHGLDGRGGERAPNIATVAKVQLASDGELLELIQRGIPSQGMPGFSNNLSAAQLRAVVTYLRELQGKQDVVGNHGNAQAGKDLFFGNSKCADCHSMHGRGGFIASDLSSFGTTHSAQEIRSAITEPDKNRDRRSELVTVATAHGQKYTGVARNEDNFSLQLQTLDGKFHFLEKSELVLVRRGPRSLMPDDYGSRLTSSQLEDLVAYLLDPQGK